MPKPEQQDFSLELTRFIEPKEGPGVELLEDAARFMGHMRPWRQARPHWDYEAPEVRFQRQAVIEPKGGPGVELATLEDAARFMGHMQPWSQSRPYWDYAAALVLKSRNNWAAEGRGGGDRSDGAGVAHG